MDGCFSFAQRLVAARKRLGLDQKELVQLLDGVAQSTVSKWETGGSEPSVENIRKIAEALQCTADYLVGITDHPSALPPNHWVIDRDREGMILKKQVPPDGGRWAWPVPEKCDIVSSVDYERRRDKAYGKSRKEAHDHD